MSIRQFTDAWNKELVEIADARTGFGSLYGPTAANLFPHREAPWLLGWFDHGEGELRAVIPSEALKEGEKLTPPLRYAFFKGLLELYAVYKNKETNVYYYKASLPLPYHADGRYESFRKTDFLPLDVEQVLEELAGEQNNNRLKL